MSRAGAPSKRKQRVKSIAVEHGARCPLAKPRLLQQAERHLYRCTCAWDRKHGR